MDLAPKLRRHDVRFSLAIQGQPSDTGDILMNKEVPILNSLVRLRHGEEPRIRFRHGQHFTTTSSISTSC
jgi:hypothetical protein